MRLNITNYSEKAIALTGDTKEVREQLKALGGRFNARLSCGAGWIFSKAKENALRDLVTKLTSTTPTGKAPEGAAVYVGTYGKYNSGSLSGAWLNLNDYESKAAFLEACKDLHKDEKTPEFMFQDFVNIPNWLISESDISESIWGYSEESEPKGKQTKAEIEAILMANNISYPAAKDVAELVEVDGRVFIILKQDIETRFCHADEPDDEVRAWLAVCRTWDYFKDENMKAFDKDNYVSLLKDSQKLFIYKVPNIGNSWWFTNEPEKLWKGTESIPMPDATRRKLIDANNRARAAFEKRLSMWWKRYGADHLHCWTYWRDA